MVKKKVKEVVITPVEVEPVVVAEPMVEELTPTPVVESEVMLTVATLEDFKDGALHRQFAKYGYKVEWKKGERRTIDVPLFKRCRASGAKLEIIVTGV